MTSFRIVFFLLALCGSYLAQAQFHLSLESGTVWNQYNSVQAPNGDVGSGTRFSLTDDFTPEQPKIFLRAQISYLVAGKHRIELTAVPLTFEYEKNQIDFLAFENKLFPATTTKGTYQFNTYRASYRYRFLNREKIRLEAGLSLLVRDAKISLESSSTMAENTDLGFVPLVSFRLEAGASDGLQFLLAGDALVGPVGRAEDVFIGITYPLMNERLNLLAGYRVIEGGADVDQVYNFALFHFANVGLRLQL